MRNLFLILKFFFAAICTYCFFSCCAPWREIWLHALLNLHMGNERQQLDPPFEVLSPSWTKPASLASLHTSHASGPYASWWFFTALVLVNEEPKIRHRTPDVASEVSDRLAITNGHVVNKAIKLQQLWYGPLRNVTCKQMLVQLNCWPLPSELNSQETVFHPSSSPLSNLHLLSLAKRMQQKTVPKALLKLKQMLSTALLLSSYLTTEDNQTRQAWRATPDIASRKAHSFIFSDCGEADHSAVPWLLFLSF